MAEGFAWEAGEDMNALTGGKAIAGDSGDIFSTQDFSSDGGGVSFAPDLPAWVLPVAGGVALYGLVLWLRKK